MVKKLWKLLEPFHKTFGWFIALIVVYEGMQVAESYVLSLVINLFGDGVVMAIWFGVIGILVVYDEIFMRIDNAVDWHIIIKHSYPIYRHLKTTAIAKLLELDITWHEENNSGTLIGKLNNGVWKILEITDNLSWEFIPTLIQTLLSLIPLLIFSPLITLVAFVALVIFLWLTVKSNQARKDWRKTRHDRYEDEWHKSVEAVQSIETITGFSQSQRIQSEFQGIHNSIQEFGLKETKVGVYTYSRWQIRIMSWARRIILAIWIWQLLEGTLDIAGLVYVNVLTEKLFHSFWRFGRLFNVSTEASESAERLVNLIAEQPKIVDSNNSSSPQNNLQSISFDNVCFSYSGEYQPSSGTIHSFSLNIQPGQTIALVGPSGAGKTTFRKLVTRLVDINSGQILVGGIDVRNWPVEELRQAFSFVPQGDDVYIYSNSVLDNIRFARPEASLAEVIEASKLAGIHEHIQTLKEDYNTLLGERGKKLSGGQKQRLALARAILANRPILILDEATSAVDAITEKEIQQGMKEILKNKTAIIVAHRLSTIWDLADVIIVMDHGRIVESGSHQQLINEDGLYAEMVRLQSNS